MFSALLPLSLALPMPTSPLPFLPPKRFLPARQVLLAQCFGSEGPPHSPAPSTLRARLSVPPHLLPAGTPLDHPLRQPSQCAGCRGPSHIGPKAASITALFTHGVLGTKQPAQVAAAQAKSAGPTTLPWPVRDPGIADFPSAVKPRSGVCAPEPVCKHRAVSDFRQKLSV